MNRNDYRRALIMLRSQNPGISGYVRLERRTLIGTLEFTVNGISSGSELCAVLLSRSNGVWNAIRLDRFSAPRSGQVGLSWKFDPRNVQGKAFEQYALAAVVDIKDGSCNMLLCGNINGSVDADWNGIKTAACRLFTPVRISGSPIPSIPEKQSEPSEQEESGQLSGNAVICNTNDTGSSDSLIPNVLYDNSSESTDMSAGIASVSEPSISVSSKTPIEIDSDQQSSGETVTAELIRSETDVSTLDGDKFHSATSDEPVEAPTQRLTCSSTLQPIKNPYFSESSSFDLKHKSEPISETAENKKHSESDRPISTNPCSEQEETVMNFSEPTAICENPDAAPVQNSANYNTSTIGPITIADNLDVPAYSQYVQFGENFDQPAIETAAVPDKLDIPADENNNSYPVTESVNEPPLSSASCSESIRSDSKQTAADQLNLNDQSAVWPQSIESLRALFFSSESVVPFETNGFIFIRVPLHSECTASSCLCGIRCENGVPAQVCYAIPSQYSPEPPAGLEGYAWRGDHMRGYWVVIDDV